MLLLGNTRNDFLELIQLGLWVSDFVVNTSLRASFRGSIALRLRTSPAVPVYRAVLITGGAIAVQHTPVAI